MELTRDEGDKSYKISTASFLENISVPQSIRTNMERKTDIMIADKSRDDDDIAVVIDEDSDELSFWSDVKNIGERIVIKFFGNKIKIEKTSETENTITILGTDVGSTAASLEGGNILSESVNPVFNVGTWELPLFFGSVGGTANNNQQSGDTNGNSWSQIGQTITENNSSTTEKFGNSVAINSEGTRIAIGAAAEYDYYDNGYVEIYDLSGSGANASWVQVGGDISGESPGDFFGNSVAMNSSGTRIAIGAPGNDGENGNGYDDGQIKVFDLSGSGSNASWTQVGQSIYGFASDDFLGWSIAMNSSGTRFISGARYGNDEDGQARVFDLSGTGINASWVQVGQNLNGAYLDEFGHSVAINNSGSRIAIGALVDDSDLPMKGYVRVYDLSGSGTNASWVQVGNIVEGDDEGDQLGRSVSMNGSGSRIVIGSTFSDGSGNNFPAAGEIKVFDLSGSGTNSSWVQVGNSIYGENQNDRLGRSVAMSDDGTRIVTGVYYNDGNSGNTDDDRGSVKIYDWNGSAWTQIGTDIVGENTDDQFGRSVAISENGNKIIAGAIGGDEIGSVRVFEYENSEEETPTGDICFPAGTPVQTDQGEIAIEKLTCENTIDGVNVVAVVPVYNECDYLVKINKHALGPNYPKKTTLVSRNHRVYLNKKREETIPALALYNGKTVTVVQREEHETIYNVLLPTYSKMTINGLVVETLHPKKRLR